jgi:hypothetical protein
MRYRRMTLLSPYVCILLADILLQILRKAHDNSFLLHPVQQGAPLPVLQYTDDTLLILKGSAEQAVIVKTILDAFATFSWLKINYQKSTMVPMNLDLGNTSTVAQILGFQISSLLCTYLGLPLSMNNKECYRRCCSVLIWCRNCYIRVGEWL